MRGELVVEERAAEDVAGGVPHASEGPPARSLGFWCRYLAEHGGCVPGVDGEQVPVDLSAWDGAPDSTLLAVSVRWVDPALVGTVDPDPPVWLQR